MKRHFLKLAATGAILSVFATNLFALKQTTGTPLGGFGASYIVYNGANGKFVKGFRLSGNHWYQEASLDAQFDLYTKSGSSVKTVSAMKSADEDALIPIYRVKYGAANNNIDVNLLAFGPYVTGDEKSVVMPLAFFEFEVTNKNGEAAEAAIAFQMKNLISSGTGTRLETSDGVTWAGAENATVRAFSDIESATITTGNTISEFNSSGALSNNDGNIVAIKATLEPSQVARFRFVVGWWQNFSDKDWNGTVQNEGFYYHNFVANSVEAADYGIKEFVRIRDGASAFADRIRAVNLPEWFTDKLLNSLYPFTHNSQYAKDGRMAWREGKYFIIGTIDQQGHSQIATSYNWPESQWNQMEYWARTQWRDDYLGQIHHDFNGPKSGSDKVNAMSTWDDYNHNDYWWSKTKNWSDLNSLFLINVYELFLATANMEKLDKLWPYMQNTAARLLHQAKRCIDNQYQVPPAPYDSNNYVLPHECLGSYDREGSTNEYNGSLALNAYSAMKEMCLAKGLTEEAAKWDDIFKRGKEQFSKIYTSTSTYGTKVEGELGSYSWSRHLGLPVIMSDDEAKAGFSRYWVKSQNGKDLNPWHFYTINHFGDFGIAIGDADKGLTVHKYDYDKFYAEQPRYAFWQDLDDGFALNSYMTAPVVWRTLLLITGYCLDKHNQRLWLRPVLPTANNGNLTNAPLINPGNWGTMNYKETDNGKTQSITVKFDSPVTVKELRLKNPDGGDHTVKVVNATGEIAKSVIKSGSGLDAILTIAFESPITIDKNGIAIGVDVDPPSISVRRTMHKQSSVSSLKSFSEGSRQVFTFSVTKPGNFAIDVFSVNGKRVSSIKVGHKAAGTYTVSGNSLAKGFYFVHLKNDNSYVMTTPILIAR
jgi:hypothetical protein